MGLSDNLAPEERFEQFTREAVLKLHVPIIRFYDGIATYDHKSGIPISVFCIKDKEPREFTVQEISIFLDIAQEVEKEINR